MPRVVRVLRNGIKNMEHLTNSEKLDSAARYAKSLIDLGYDMQTVEQRTEAYMEEIDAMNVPFDEWSPAGI